MDISIFLKAKDLKKRVIFSLLALFVFRFGSYLTIPGINSVALNDIAQANSAGILGMFNMLSGGSLSRMSIFSLAIFPYITASIVMQLLVATFKPLEEMKKEGGAGRKKINQYTRYLTVFLCVFQAYAMAISLEKLQSNGVSVVIIPGLLFKITAVTTLVVGTMFLMWLGEQITARGIGNGISLIIFAGIVAGLPQAFISVFELVRNGAMSPVTLIILLIAIFGLIYFIVAVERAQRKVPVQYPKRQKGNKVFGGENTHLPLKLNTAGVIPAIFANSILLFPLTITNFVAAKEDSIMETILIYLGRGKPLYLVLYVLLIGFFCFFYTAVVFNVNETADMLKRNGGFLHGKRPGSNTAEYLDYVLTRLTVIGACYISFICVIPEYVSSKYSIPFYLGGTSFLIVVNVVMDTFVQVQSSLFSYQYEGLIKKSKLRRG